MGCTNNKDIKHKRFNKRGISKEKDESPEMEAKGNDKETRKKTGVIQRTTENNRLSEHLVARK